MKPIEKPRMSGVENEVRVAVVVECQDLTLAVAALVIERDLLNLAIPAAATMRCLRVTIVPVLPS